MKSFCTLAVTAVLVLAAAAHGTHAHLHERAPPLETRQYKTLVYEGCYSAAGSLAKNTTYTYNTQGFCQQQCVPAGFSVEGVSAGKECYCGNELPPSDSKVDDSKCDSPCAGYGEDNCGGPDHFSVYLTGLEDDVSAESDTSTLPITASPAGTTTAAPSVVTVGGQTMTVTAGTTPIPSVSEAKSGGPSKAGIAAGVVVGVTVIAAAVGGVFFYLRHKKRRALEEEHKQAAAINSFISNGKQQPMSSSGASFDTHLDQSIMASNRMSNGSLADNTDYSRRILKVTNA